MAARTRTLSAVFLAFVFVAGTVPGHAAEKDVETIRFGVCLALSGPFANYGATSLAGITLAVDDINSRAGEYGFRLEAVVHDNAGLPRLSARHIDEFADMGIAAVIGPVKTEVMLPMLEAARRREVVVITPTGTGNAIGVGDDWGFRVLFSDDDQGRALARYATERLDARKAGALVNTYFAYSGELLAAFSAAYGEMGGRLTRVEDYEWDFEEATTPNYINALDNIKATLPDIIMLPAFSEDVTAVIPQSRLVNLAAPFFGGDAWFTRDLLVASGHNLENAFYAYSCDFDADRPQLRRFLDLYDSSHDPDASLASVDAFDAVTLLAEALKSGRSGTEIRDALRRLRNFPLIGSDLTYDPERGTVRTVFVHRVEKGEDGFDFKTVAEYTF